VRMTEAWLSEAGGRETNQDRVDFVTSGPFKCWVVCDGLGGHRGGEEASRLATAAMTETFMSAPGCSADLVRYCLQAGEDALLRVQAENPDLEQMRTTAVVLLSDGDRAVWGHVGDSRLYHFREGHLHGQTRDHSVPQVLADTGDITHDQIRHHEDRSRILRSLGSGGELKPALSADVALMPGDAFLLCTDGFWEFVLEHEMESDLLQSSAADAQTWLDTMVGRLRQRASGEFDNLSALTVVVGEREAEVASAYSPPPVSLEEATSPSQAPAYPLPVPSAHAASTDYGSPQALPYAAHRRSTVFRAAVLVPVAVLFVSVLALAAWWLVPKVLKGPGNEKQTVTSPLVTTEQPRPATNLPLPESGPPQEDADCRAAVQKQYDEQVRMLKALKVRMVTREGQASFGFFPGDRLKVSNLTKAFDKMLKDCGQESDMYVPRFWLGLLDFYKPGNATTACSMHWQEQGNQEFWAAAGGARYYQANEAKVLECQPKPAEVARTPDKTSAPSSTGG